MTLTRFTVVLVVLLLVASACSSEPETGNLTPLAACPDDAPDCDDILVTGDDDLFPGDEPDDGVRPGSSGMLVEGGLAVSEALTTDATGTIAVQGFYFSTSEGTWLCELMAESFPPQCGEPRLRLGDTTGIDLGELTSAQGVTWSDHLVTIFGQISDGTLIPDPHTTG